jgi:rhamnosyltransferase
VLQKENPTACASGITTSDTVAMPSGKPYVSVFIPTWFAGNALRKTLDMVTQQRTDFPFEVLLFDTSSSDETPRIIAQYRDKYPFVRTKTITKAQFGHGRTRQLAALEAHGEIVAYLTQDAVPADDRWLAELVKPFSDSKVAGVVGRQSPRPDAPPVLKYDIERTFRSLGPAIGIMLYSRNSKLPRAANPALYFYSDANSAARRSVLLGDVPYRDIDYAEDQAFGYDIISAGYTKAYTPFATVIHSNDITLQTFRKRIFDETVGLRKAGIPVERISLPKLIYRVLRGSLSCAYYTAIDPGYSFGDKLRYIFTNPFYLLEKWAGARQGALVDLNDIANIKANSLMHTQAVERKHQLTG